jgi:hypothetical protein
MAVLTSRSRRHGEGSRPSARCAASWAAVSRASRDAAWSVRVAGSVSRVARPRVGALLEQVGDGVGVEVPHVVGGQEGALDRWCGADGVYEGGGDGVVGAVSVGGTCVAHPDPSRGRRWGWGTSGGEGCVQDGGAGLLAGAAGIHDVVPGAVEPGQCVGGDIAGALGVEEGQVRDGAEFGPAGGHELREVTLSAQRRGRTRSVCSPASKIFDAGPTMRGSGWPTMAASFCA